MGQVRVANADCLTGDAVPLDAALMGHLVCHLGPLRKEVLLALFYDGEGFVLGHYLDTGGSAGYVSGRYRALIEPAFALGASGMALVHNHPSGDPTPSKGDIRATRRIEALSLAMDIAFLDHAIIGGRAAVSMRRAGLMGFAGRTPAMNWNSQGPRLAVADLHTEHMGE